MGEDTTLLSRSGWRLTRKTEDDGQITLEWRCPPCWTRHRQLKAVKEKR
jgi:hypothetical protein